MGVIMSEQQDDTDNEFLEQSEISESDSYQDIMTKILKKKVPKAFEGA